MGATRESSCSGGILAAWPLCDDAGVDDCCSAYARCSPGTRVIVQRIATKDLHVSPIRSGFIITSPPSSCSLSVGPIEEKRCGSKACGFTFVFCQRRITIPAGRSDRPRETLDAFVPMGPAPVGRH